MYQSISIKNIVKFASLVNLEAPEGGTERNRKFIIEMQV